MWVFGVKIWYLVSDVRRKCIVVEKRCGRKVDGFARMECGGSSVWRKYIVGEE